MRHILQILLEELENDLLKSVYLADINRLSKGRIERGIKASIKRFHESRRVPEYKKERAFVKHIENHFKDMPEPFLKVVCKICNKDIDQINEETDMIDIV